MPSKALYFNYYAFGSAMPGRTGTAPGGDYRFGFNGKEDDGETGTQDYGLRIYNPSLGKFLSVDPLSYDYPWYTPYQFAGNIPIAFIDLDGAEPSQPGTQGGEIQKAPQQGSNSCTEYNWMWDDCNWNICATSQSVNIEGQHTMSDSQWKADFAKMGDDGYNNYVNKLYETKLYAHQTHNGMNELVYGLNSDGSVAVPQDLKNRLWKEANEEALPALKSAWAADKSGVDPTSWNYMFNPFARAQYYYWRCLTVSNRSEGMGIWNEVAFQVAVDWGLQLIANSTAVKVHNYKTPTKAEILLTNIKPEELKVLRGAKRNVFMLENRDEIWKWLTDGATTNIFKFDNGWTVSKYLSKDGFESILINTGYTEYKIRFLK